MRRRAVSKSMPGIREPRIAQPRGAIDRNFGRRADPHFDRLRRQRGDAAFVQAPTAVDRDALAAPQRADRLERLFEHRRTQADVHAHPAALPFIAADPALHDEATAVDAGERRGLFRNEHRIPQRQQIQTRRPRGRPIRRAGGRGSASSGSTAAASRDDRRRTTIRAPRRAPRAPVRSCSGRRHARRRYRRHW